MDDEVFKALADPTRRLLLDRLNERNGQSLLELSVALDMTRQSVTKHLAVLEAANLVTTMRRGREKLHYLNAEPINAISDRWITQYDRRRLAALADLKTALESTAMTNTAVPDIANANTTNDFVYTTYIKAPAELVFKALTDPTFTREYWNGVEIASDWKVGSPYTFSQVGVTIDDPQMIVTEYSPYTRIAYTWPTMTHEYISAVGLPPEFADEAAKEPRSTVSFELEQQDTRTKLTVVQSGFGPTGVVLGSISHGWPQVMAELKSLLESQVAAAR